METEEFKDIVVFYHGNCLDGFAGAYAAWKKLGPSATYLPLGYYQEIPTMNGKEIYFIDITPRKEKLSELIKNNEVTGIDHHESTKDDIEVLQNKVYSEEVSGAYLAWEFFHPGTKIPELIHYVSKHDMWEHDIPGIREFSIFLRTIPVEFTKWDDLAEKMETNEGKRHIIETGSLLHSYRLQLVSDIIHRTIREVEFEGHTVHAVNSPVLANSLAEELYKDKPFAIIWCHYRESIKVSLRGKGEVDLSKVAEKYGGGGHPNSSGFELPKNSPLPWTEIK